MHQLFFNIPLLGNCEWVLNSLLPSWESMKLSCRKQLNGNPIPEAGKYEGRSNHALNPNSFNSEAHLHKHIATKHTYTNTSSYPTIPLC